jgi:hypothetical protein
MAIRIIRILCCTLGRWLSGPKGAVDDIFYWNLLASSASEDACKVCLCSQSEQLLSGACNASCFCGCCLGCRKAQDEIPWMTTRINPHYTCSFCSAHTPVESAGDMHRHACQRCYYIGILWTNGVRQRFARLCQDAIMTCVPVARNATNTTQLHLNRRRCRRLARQKAKRAKLSPNITTLSNKRSLDTVKSSWSDTEDDLADKQVCQESATQTAKRICAELFLQAAIGIMRILQ